MDTPKRRKTASKKLRRALENDAAGNGERRVRVYVQLPRPTDHLQHVTGEVCAIKTEKASHNYYHNLQVKMKQV